MKLLGLVSFLWVKDWGFGSPNQLGDIWGKVKIKVYFFKGRGRPHVN
jgi:hypothetical protein